MTRFLMRSFFLRIQLLSVIIRNRPAKYVAAHPVRVVIAVAVVHDDLPPPADGWSGLHLAIYQRYATPAPTTPRDSPPLNTPAIPAVAWNAPTRANVQVPQAAKPVP